MKKIKAILFDVDDTIYSHKLKRIPELTKYTIKKLKENGYILGLCTSRFPREFQSLPNDIFDDFDLVIADTGGIILKDNKIIHIESMNKEDIDQCIQYLDEQKNMFYLWVPVDGQPHFSSEPSEHLRQHNISWSGYCPTVQKYHNESLTNILFFDADEKQMNEIIEKVSLDQWVKTLPNGADTILSEAGCEMSGGQKQRIGIARALYKKASVLMFDEATSALDNETEKEINATLQQLKENGETLTILSIAHRESSLSFCDRIITIEDE